MFFNKPRWIAICFFVSVPMFSCFNLEAANVSGGLCLFDVGKHGVDKERKNIIIRYKSGFRCGVISGLADKQMNVIYDLNSMNTIVVSVPEKKIHVYMDFISSFDGVLSVQEDGVVSFE